ncbi:MAG: hypothetical protein AB7N76_01505 [Planctomycetota bacterium]
MPRRPLPAALHALALTALLCGGAAAQDAPPPEPPGAAAPDAPPPEPPGSPAPPEPPGVRGARGTPAPALPDARRELEELRRRLEALEARQAAQDPKTPQGRSALGEALDDLLGRLRLSGYAVAGYEYIRRSHTSLAPLLREHQFRASDLSLYLRASLPFDFSTSTQVVFRPRPQDNVVYEDEDIEVERAFVQWAPLAQLKLKLGKWITPAGYWTYLIHDEPLLPTLTTPLIVRRRIFPEEGFGLLLEGDQSLGAVRLGYAAWVSNGQTRTQFFDDNADKAYGGRLYLAAEDLGPIQLLQVGVSAYTGLAEEPLVYTRDDAALSRVALAEGRGQTFFSSNFDDRGLTPWGEPIRGQRDRAIGCDLVLDLSGLHVRAELMIDWVHVRQRGLSDFVEWGAYAYLGYAFRLPELTRAEGDPIPLGTIEPYVRWDVYDGSSNYVHELQSLTMTSVGATYTLNRYLQLRAEATWYRYREGARDTFGVQTGVVGSF